MFLQGTPSGRISTESTMPALCPSQWIGEMKFSPETPHDLNGKIHGFNGKIYGFNVDFPLKTNPLIVLSCNVLYTIR